MTYSRDSAALACYGLLHDIASFGRWAGVEVTPDMLKRLRGEDKPADAPIIALAARLAAAHERELPQPSSALLSVFSRLQLTEKSSTPKGYMPIQPLSLSKKTFEPLSERELTNTERDKKALWRDFIENMDKLRGINHSEAYVEALQSLLFRYGWCVPSRFSPEGDVSLYDHSRITAALAACMSGLENEVAERLLKKTDATPVAVFVEGDISGIQRFIYSIPMSGAAKQLRARSLYLQLLTEFVARYILRQFGMPMTNMVYAGGGHFYLLLPPYAAEKLNDMRRAIEQLLLDHHDGELYIAIGHTVLTAQDFSHEKFDVKWRELKEAIGAVKSRRYHSQDTTVLTNFFAPRQLQDEFLARSIERDARDDDDEPQSNLGKSFVEFAKQLKSAEAIVIGYLDAPKLATGKGMNALFNELGFTVGLVYSSFKQIYYPTFKNLAYAMVVGLRELPDWHLCAEVSLNAEGCPVAPVLRYTVNETPMVNDDYRPADFDELSEASEGIKRLGVLRMDVDNLGTLFSNGFKRKLANGQVDSIASLTRVASLSVALSLFFEGWVGELCRSINEQKRLIGNEKSETSKGLQVSTVYPIYSGGDDLFIVGSWDVLPELARRIQEDFARFALGNRDVHISAGITLHVSKYPLFLAAEDAEGALKAAKQGSKNAITFLGETVSWTKWDRVIAHCQTLYDLVKLKEGINRSFLRLIMQFHADYEAQRKQQRIGKNGQKQVLWGPWMWRSAYQFTRFAERHKAHESTIKELHKQFQEDEFYGIVLAGIAARWVDALTRSNEGE